MGSKHNYLLLVIGPVKSGKSSTVNIIVEDYGIYNKKINRLIPVTTKPKSNKDKHVLDYEFISDKKFEELKHNDELISYSEFNTINGIHKYGLRRSTFNTITDYTNNILITNLTELKSIINNIPKDVSPIIIDMYASKTELLKRNKLDKTDKVDKEYEKYLPLNIRLEYSIPVIDVNCDNSSVYIVAEYIEKTYETLKANDVRQDFLKQVFND